MVEGINMNGEQLNHLFDLVEGMDIQEFIVTTAIGLQVFSMHSGVDISILSHDVEKLAIEMNEQFIKEISNDG